MSERKILFRGKRVDNGEWVYGAHITRADRHFIVDYNSSNILQGCTTLQEDQYLFRAIKCDPSTIGQYTGLIDKNGKPIFEGDIVQTPKYGIDNGKGHNYSGKDKFCVGFADGTFFIENRKRRFCLRQDEDMEVIGNIHDNPELLEEKE